MAREITGEPLNAILGSPLSLDVPTGPSHGIDPDADIKAKFPGLTTAAPFPVVPPSTYAKPATPMGPQDMPVPLGTPPVQEDIADTPVPKPNPGMGRGLRRARDDARRYAKMMEEGMTREFEAKAAEADEKAARLKALLDQKMALHRQMEDAEKTYTKQQKEELDHYRVLSHRAQQEIDPERWQKTRNVGQTIAQAIAVTAGAYLHGSSGGRIPNVAQRMIDRYIERDIDAQKANANIRGNAADRQLNLMQYMRQAYGDEQKARVATKTRMLEEAEDSLRIIAERAKSPVLQARLMQELGALKQKQVGLRAQLVGRGSRQPNLTQVAKQVKAKADILKYSKQAEQAVKGKPLDKNLQERLDAAETALKTIQNLEKEVRGGFDYDVFPTGKKAVQQAKFKQARDRLLDASLRAKTGAQANKEEIEKEEQLYGDAPGRFSSIPDAFGASTKQKNLAKFKLNRQDMLDVIRQVASTAAERGQKLPKRFRDLIKAEASRRLAKKGK